MQNLKIRLATENDSAAMLAIYAYYVENTPITFEYKVPSVAEFAQRMKRIQKQYPWLVCEVGQKIAGYAYADMHSEREAYKWSVHYSVYIDRECQGGGVGRQLYHCLTNILRLQGYCKAYAVITSPNAQSEGFHQSLGFKRIGVFANAGYKLGKWHDVSWYELALREAPDKPMDPKAVGEIAISEIINISIRPERESDYRAVEELTREAFWDVYKPGCDEHLLVHKIRKAPAFVRELSYVACDNGKIVGNIMYSKAKIVDGDDREYEVLCMGPLGVLPDYQKRGIGSLLMQETLKRAGGLGYKAVIIFGNPAYYGRFGFDDAKRYRIQTSAGENFDAFMARELYTGALDGIHGRFYEDEIFKIEEAELEEFEKEFPYREKHVTDTQLK